MRKRIGIPVAAALWIGLGATTAQAAATSCVTPAEGAGLMLVLAPEAIKGVGTACAQALPPTALLRQTGGAFMEKYEAEANAAWPQAKLALGKISGGNSSAMLESDLLRQVLSATIVAEVTKGIKAKDCGAIDHIVTLLAPLPPKNAAELVVTIIQMKDEGDRAGSKSEFPICPMIKP